MPSYYAKGNPSKRQKRDSSPKRRKKSSGSSYVKKGYLNRRGTANRELGYVDLATATYDFNTTGTITLIATVVQGAAVTQRVGKKILLKSLQIRGLASSDSATTTGQGALIIVYDKRPTGALPNITDVLNTATFNSFINDANSGRFKIIRRMNFAFAGNNTTGGQQTEASNYVIDEFIKLKNRQTVFKAVASGAIGDIEEGALYAITVGNTVTGVADQYCNVGYRTRFLDV